jgi:hypothetical protein
LGKKYSNNLYIGPWSRCSTAEFFLLLQETEDNFDEHFPNTGIHLKPNDGAGHGRGTDGCSC